MRHIRLVVLTTCNRFASRRDACAMFSRLCLAHQRSYRTTRHELARQLTFLDSKVVKNTGMAFGKARATVQLARTQHQPHATGGVIKSEVVAVHTPHEQRQTPRVAGQREVLLFARHT